MARQNILTDEQLAIFREIYPTTINKELAEMFNVSVNFIAKKASSLGVKNARCLSQITEKITATKGTLKRD